MKKLLVVISIILNMTMIGSFATADEFEIRGVKFGSTLEEVKKIEILEFDSIKNDKVYYFKGTLSGIDNSRIGYGFDDDGKLTYVIIEYNNGASKAIMKKDYSTINSALITKYGNPLGYKAGKTHEFTGLNMGLFIAMVPYASLVDMDYDYDEWWIETDGGHVKIDQVYSYIQSKDKNTGLNALEYTFISDDEANKVLGDI